MIGIVVNPHAKKNRRNPNRILRLRELVGEHGVVRQTEHVGELRRVIREFREMGVKYWTSDGGDGALHWLLNECVVEFGLDEATKLVFVPTRVGTINFMAAALGVRGRGNRIIGRVVEHVRDGTQPKLVDAPSMHITATAAPESGESDLDRYAFATALAGYGANFYGPFYAGETGRGAARILALLGGGFGSAAVGAVTTGPLRRFRPAFVDRAVHDFLRPLRGTVAVDGEPFCGADGAALREFTILHAGSVPVNLANVLRAFPLAAPGRPHVHVGYISTAGAVPALLKVAAGSTFNAKNAYDGPATSLDVVADPGSTMIPCLDGELFEGIQTIALRPGPSFRFAAP